MPNRIIRPQGRINQNETETRRDTLPDHSAPTGSSALKVGSSEKPRKIARGSTPNFRSMDLPNHLEL
jgi:hypothetical protein